MSYVRRNSYPEEYRPVVDMMRGWAISWGIVLLIASGFLESLRWLLKRD